MLAQGLLVLQNDGQLHPVTKYVMTVTVDPIYADAGRVDVTGDLLQGSGQFIAPADASVTVTNETPAYLQLLGITIPEDIGGLYFNGDIVHNDSPQLTNPERQAQRQRRQQAQLGSRTPACRPSRPATRSPSI